MAVALHKKTDHSPGGIEALGDLVRKDMESVNALILSRTGSNVLLIPDVANHLISSGGKRLRPMLTLACAALVGADKGRAQKLAAAVEFMHTATLLHDDVVDESDMRRGKQTARKVWGNEASVLVGDFLLGQAFKMMVETGSLEALDILSSAAAVIAEGEVMQLAATKKLTTTQDEYFRVITAKTAALFAAACAVGPALARSGDTMQKALHEYGLHLGIAFQLVDDALDYAGAETTMGKNTGDDFREGKITLPIILSYAKADEKSRAFFERSFVKPSRSDEDLKQANALLTSSGAIDATFVQAESYGQRARDALQQLQDSDIKSALLQVVDFCLTRRF